MARQGLRSVGLVLFSLILVALANGVASDSSMRSDVALAASNVGSHGGLSLGAHSEEAYVTLLYTDDFLLGARVLAHSLRLTFTKRCVREGVEARRIDQSEFLPRMLSNQYRNCVNVMWIISIYQSKTT